MTNSERIKRILHYQDADRLPLVHFGYWRETLLKWADEGHITVEQARTLRDGNAVDTEVSAKLGFDMNWQTMFVSHPALNPAFERKVIEQFPDGSRSVLTGEGVIILEKRDAGSIPPDIDHLLKDRASWEEHYVPRLQFDASLIQLAKVPTGHGYLRFDEGGLEYLQQPDREHPVGLHLGSLYGTIRNWLTLEGSCYLQADDEELFTEIIDTFADLQYRYAKAVLETGARFDYAHFWEDICFKSGPLIAPSVFAEKVGPHYRRFTDLVNQYGIDIISLDCDGCIDALVPIWLENGVNTMFPIEVGTWQASIAPWREKYGKQIRGVGGMNKNVFARDFAAVDAEVERLQALVDLGGYIPCPDHRIPPNAEWDNVRYYCDRMHQIFG